MRGHLTKREKKDAKPHVLLSSGVVVGISFSCRDMVVFFAGDGWMLFRRKKYRLDRIEDKLNVPDAALHKVM